MNCSVCEQENDSGYRFCSRCGAAEGRRIPTLLLLGTFFTREMIWGITLSGWALTWLLLRSGHWGGWLFWQAIGFASYWAICGFVFLGPGTFFTLSMLPMFRGAQSILFNLGIVMAVSTVDVAVLGLGFFMYLYGDFR